MSDQPTGEIEKAIKLLAEYLPENFAIVRVAGGVGLFDLSAPLSMEYIIAGGWDNIARNLQTRKDHKT